MGRRLPVRHIGGDLWGGGIGSTGGDLHLGGFFTELRGGGGLPAPQGDAPDRRSWGGWGGVGFRIQSPGVAWFRSMGIEPLPLWGGRCAGHGFRRDAAVDRSDVRGPGPDPAGFIARIVLILGDRQSLGHR